ELKPPRLHKSINLAVEMTATAEAFPTGCQAMLPPCDPAVRRKPMLHEQQTAIMAQYAPHFAQRRDHLRYRAQRPCRHHRVEDIVIKWNDFGRCLYQIRSDRRVPAGSPQQRSRRLDAVDARPLP